MKAEYYVRNPWTYSSLWNTDESAGTTAIRVLHYPKPLRDKETTSEAPYLLIPVRTQKF